MTASPYAPTLESVPAPESRDEPTLRSVQTRDWRVVSRELDAQIRGIFDAAGSLPPATVIRLMAELGRMRGDA